MAGVLRAVEILGTLAAIAWLLRGFWRDYQMRKSSRWLPVLVLLLLPSLADAATCYVRDGGTATGTQGRDSNGGSWSQAYDQLSTAETNCPRGDTIFVADGTYSAVTFNTAASGTTLISICKATVSTVGSCGSAHGTSTGWDDTYGDGQAIFGTGEGSANVTTNYWLFDGVVGAGSTNATGSDVSTYGFRFNGGSGTDTDGVFLISFADNVTVKHTAVQCGFDDTYKEFGFAHDSSAASDNTTLSYVYVDGCQVNMWMQGDNLIVEYSYLGRNWSSASNHGVTIEAIVSPIIRYNYFLTCAIQCIEPGGGSTTDISNGKIYGNIITNLTSNANNKNNGAANGFIKGVSSGHISNTVIYNNTLYNSEGPLLYESNFGGATGNVVRNNICYLCSGDFIIDDGAVTTSHNWLINYTGGAFTETGGGGQTSSGNPFLTLTLGGFFLNGNPLGNAGFTLSSPYDVDLYGTTRAANGTWQRGAVQTPAAGGGGTVILFLEWAPLVIGLGWHFRQAALTSLIRLSLASQIMAALAVQKTKSVGYQTTLKVLTSVNEKMRR